MKPVFATIIFLAACCLTAVAGPKINSGDFEVPFTFERGNVIVKAKIRGKVPVEVVVATGSKNSLVDSALLEKYKLPSAYSGVGPVSGTSSDRIYVFSSVPEVTVGEAKASLSMRLGSMQELSAALGREIFGSLGADFFKGRTVRFDFQKRVLTFLDQSTTKALKDNSTGGEGDRKIVLEMIEPDNPYGLNTIVPVVAVTFDGKKAKVVLNTGMVTVISLSSSTAKKMGLTLPPEKSAARTDKIGSVYLGGYELKAVPVIISAKGTYLDHALEEPGAAIGTVFLQNFVSTFDFRHKRVILEPVQRRDNN